MRLTCTYKKDIKDIHLHLAVHPHTYEGLSKISETDAFIEAP
jgi:hypothetical protein